MSRSPTEHGFWMPASIGSDAWLASARDSCDERTSGLLCRVAHACAQPVSSGRDKTSFRLTKQLAVMWVIDGRKARDVIAPSCHGELDPNAPGIRGGSDL
jgi:hypothetical protein